MDDLRLCIPGLNWPGRQRQRLAKTKVEAGEWHDTSHCADSTGQEVFEGNQGTTGASTTCRASGQRTEDPASHDATTAAMEERAIVVSEQQVRQIVESELAAGLRWYKGKKIPAEKAAAMILTVLQRHGFHIVFRQQGG